MKNEMISEELETERVRLGLSLDDLNKAMGTTYFAFNDNAKLSLNDKEDGIDGVKLGQLQKDLKIRFTNMFKLVGDKLITLSRSNSDVAKVTAQNAIDKNLVNQGCLDKVFAKIDQAKDVMELKDITEAGMKIDENKYQTFLDACEVELRTGVVSKVVDTWKKAKNTIGLNDAEEVEEEEDNTLFNEYLAELDEVVGEEVEADAEADAEGDVAVDGEEEVVEDEVNGLQAQLTTLKEDLNANIETIEDKNLVKQIEEVSARIDEMATVELDAQDLLIKIKELSVEEEEEADVDTEDVDTETEDVEVEIEEEV